MTVTMHWTRVAVAACMLLAPAALGGCGDDVDRNAGTGGTATATGSGAGGSGAGAGQGGSPVVPPNPNALSIFYSDLLSGPSSGGQDDLGAFVTIYGRGFGDAQGSSTVTVGGGAVDHAVVWTDSQITFQLGAQAASGEIVVTVDGKGSSNGIPFTVRPGSIYFVGPSGAEQNDGSYAQPWASLVVAKRQLAPGDVLYAMDGTTATDLDGIRAALCIADGYGCDAQQGTAELPIALVAYPGALVTVGCTASGCPDNGLRIFNDHWTIAGLHVVGSGNTYASAIALQVSESATTMSRGQRIIGNTVTGDYYGITLGTSGDCQVLGNEVSGTPNSAIYHGGWDAGANVEIGWNVVHHTAGFGIKAYGHTATDDLTGLWIHDNFVSDTGRAAILVGGSDGGTPWVHDALIANNVIWNVTSPGEGAIRIGNFGVDETLLDAVIVHNTVVDCDASLQIDATGTARVQNNLFVQAASGYLGGSFGPGTITMDHNGYHGGGDVPAEDSVPVSGEPSFVDRATGDFHLSAGSMAIDSGVDTAVATDFDGVGRPQGTGYDIGAYEQVP